MRIKLMAFGICFLGLSAPRTENIFDPNAYIASEDLPTFYQDIPDSGSVLDADSVAQKPWDKNWDEKKWAWEPFILRIEQNIAESIDGVLRNYIRISIKNTKGAIGHNIYYKRSGEPDWRLVASINGEAECSPFSCEKNGLYFTNPGTYFFYTAPVGYDGLEEVSSPIEVFVYAGING